MSETRKIAAILVSDIVGYGRLAGADEDRILARLRALRSDLIDPTIALHRGRVVKRTGDGSLIEFRSVVDAVRCAIEVQNGMVERNAGLPPERRIEFRVGIHLGDVVEESDGAMSAASAPPSSASRERFFDAEGFASAAGFAPGPGFAVPACRLRANRPGPDRRCSLALSDPDR